MKRSGWAVACGALLAGTAACAQSFPTKPIRLIVPYAPGGSPDITSRLVAHELTRQLGQQVVVDNRVGAGGIIGTELIARAAPDGYTLGYIAFGFATSPSLFTKLPYDTLRDFQHVSLMLKGLNLLAVSPSLPVHSVKDLIAHARAHPGKLSYASTGSGTTNTLSMEMFKSMTGTNLISIPFKAAQQAIGDVSAGRVDVFCDNMPSILPHAKAGRVRGIAVTAAKRTHAAPEIPTMDEAGLPGFELVTWSGYSYQARVPRDIALRMSAEINQALRTSIVQDKFASFGYTATGSTLAEFDEFIRGQIDKWGKVIRTAGIKPQQ